MADPNSPVAAKAGAALTELRKVEATRLEAPPSTSPTWMTRLIHLLNRARRQAPPPRERERLPEYRPPPQTDAAAPHQPENVLYLAYGSNLCHATFEGGRGIRPLAAANVWVPELELTFDLPGLPYNEPCFANTRVRNRDGAATPSEESPTERTSLLANGHGPAEKAPADARPGWHAGLIGVVYEVTRADFAHILATEGGGASYRDTEVVCHPLPRSSDNDADDDAAAALPLPTGAATFVAHTLQAPASALHRAAPGRPGDWAQPSARYLGLLQTGAAEHGLPPAYREWLAGLQPYTPTSTRQSVGKWLMVLAWFPLVLSMFMLQRVTADGQGRARPWATATVKRVFAGVWLSCDWLFRPLFGEGEHTVRRAR